MTPAELAGLFAAIGSASGTLLGTGIAWGLLSARVRSNTDRIKAQEKACKEIDDKVDKHHERTDIHLEPKRDDQISQIILSSIKHVETEISEVKRHCSNRGEECAKHFGKVNNRITALTGKINGE